MPELPDLQVFSENLKKRILNKTITAVTVYNTRKIPTPDYFKRQMTGTSIRDIVRDGKETFFMLANGYCFSVHLMLHGQFFIEAPDETEKIKSKILGLIFENSLAFVVADIQNLCRVSWNPKHSRVPDVMSEKFTYKYFSGGLKRNEWRNIKTLLIEQRLMRGIGNAYADEILWKADISPESVSGKIPAEKAKDLYEAILFVLNDAIQKIKSLSPDIINGEERSFLRVHKKEFTDEGDKVIVKTIGEKTTYFTEKQKKYM